MPVTRPNCQPAVTRNWHWLMRAGFIPALTVTALAFGQGAVAPAAGQTPPSGGTVSGLVFHDLDADGVRDDGEPGLERLVQLIQGDVIVKEDESGVDGAYLIEGVPPGDYDLVTELDGAVSFCINLAVPNFDPLVVAGCLGIIPQPWHPTTPESYAVSVTGAETVQRDFGAIPFDQMVLLGRAILEDRYAPPGTVIEAVANGEVCGTTTVPTGALPGGTYRIVVLGAGEQSGCPVEGQGITFRIGGVDALETPPYLPQIGQTDPGPFIHNPVAMPNHAWFWLQAVAPAALPPGGTAVQALVDGRACAETRLETQFAGDTPLGTGFYRLIVPSQSEEPGCGRPGATVQFRFGDSQTTASAVWQTGVQRLTLDVPLPEPSPTPASTVSGTPTPSPGALPEAGGGPGGGGASGAWRVRVFALAVATMGLLFLSTWRSTGAR